MTDKRSITVSMLVRHPFTVWIRSAYLYQRYWWMPDLLFDGISMACANVFRLHCEHGDHTINQRSMVTSVCNTHNAQSDYWYWSDPVIKQASNEYKESDRCWVTHHGGWRKDVQADLTYYSAPKEYLALDSSWQLVTCTSCMPSCNYLLENP